MARHYKLSVLCNRAYDRYHSDIWSHRETDCLVRVKDQQVQLAFRGTESRHAWPRRWDSEGFSNVRDILKDLRFWPWQSDYGWKVHKGFGVGALNWVNTYFYRLATFIQFPMTITGHSLGAALAVQAAPMLKANGFTIREVVTFGEPASIYQGDFGDLAIPATSYLNANDWIRFTPPWGKTGVERTHINPKWGIGFKAHRIGEYTKALEDGRKRGQFPAL